MRAIALVHRAADRAAVRVALTLGETTLVAVAPPSAECETLLAAGRAQGAVRAIRLWDPSLESTDYLGTALTLASTVKALGELTAAASAVPTVIVCGDRGDGAVGPAVAERLSLPHLGRVLGATVDNGKVIARRRTSTGVRLYAGTPPVVLCVVDDAGPPLEKGSGAIDVWSLADAGLTQAELSYRRRFLPQQGNGPEGRPRLFADAAALAARLRADGVVKG
jgi:electron transfer flavoprotein alpha/beta subunit